MQPPLTMPRRLGNVSTSWENLSHPRKASLGVPSPVGRKVFAATTRSNRSGMLGHQSEADETAPVLADQGHPGQIERVEEEGTDPFDMAGEGVLAARRRLVRTTEPDQIGSHRPQAGCSEHRHHMTVEVTPRRLTVEQEDARSLPGSFVEVVDPKDAPVLVGNIGVVGLEGEAGEPVETVVGGAENVHRTFHLPWSGRRLAPDARHAFGP